MKEQKLTDQQIEGKIKITRREPIVLLFTNEYEKFRANKLNRNVTKKHAKALLQSLKDNGYYPYTPILCDQNFVLLDGHHKIEALALYHKETGKRLEFAFRIKYCETDEERFREMQIHNAYKKDWNLRQTLKISNTNYAKFFSYLEKEFKTAKITFKGYNKPKTISLVDYMDPNSVNKAVGISLSKSDLASKKSISEQDEQDIITLFKVVYHNLSLFQRAPLLKRVFVNNCGKIVSLLDDKKVDFQAWKIYVAENFNENFINSETFIFELEKNFRKFLREQ